MIFSTFVLTYIGLVLVAGLYAMHKSKSTFTVQTYLYKAALIQAMLSLASAGIVLSWTKLHAIEVEIKSALDMVSKEVKRSV